MGAQGMESSQDSLPSLEEPGAGSTTIQEKISSGWTPLPIPPSTKDVEAGQRIHTSSEDQTGSERMKTPNQGELAGSGHSEFRLLNAEQKKSVMNDRSSDSVSRTGGVYQEVLEESKADIRLGGETRLEEEEAVLVPQSTSLELSEAFPSHAQSLPGFQAKESGTPLEAEEPIIVTAPSNFAPHAPSRQDAAQPKDEFLTQQETERMFDSHQSSHPSLQPPSTSQEYSNSIPSSANEIVEPGWIIPSQTSDAPNFNRDTFQTGGIPFSVIGGEEALSNMEERGRFRRPGARVSDGVEVMMSRLERGDAEDIEIHDGGVIENEGMDEEKPSAIEMESMERSYLTIVAPSGAGVMDGSDAEEDITRIGPFQPRSPSEDISPSLVIPAPREEIAAMEAPPPRSSSIPKNLTLASASTIGRISTPPPRTPSTPQRHQPVSSSSNHSISPPPLPISFELPPTNIPQRQRSVTASTNASSSSSSHAAMSEKGQTIGEAVGEGIPGARLEKKEGRGTRLRKKTSKLFRIGSKDREKSDPKEKERGLQGASGSVSPPVSRSVGSAAPVLSRASTATSSSSMSGHAVRGTPTRQRFSTAPGGLQGSGTPSPPPHITMTKPSSHDLVGMQKRRDSRSSSSSSMDLPMPTRRTTELLNANSNTSEKKGRLSLPSIRRPGEVGRRRQSSDAASVISSVGSFRGKSRAQSTSARDVGTQFAEDNGSDAGDSIESLREEEDDTEGQDVFVSPMGGSSIGSTDRPVSIMTTAPSSFPAKMTAWFSTVMPNQQASASTASLQRSINNPPSPSTRGSGSFPESVASQSASVTSSPGRKTAGVAASFFNTAKQKAVGGVRYLLDVEAQPDGCVDIIWVMGVSHRFATDPPPVPAASSSDGQNNARTGSIARKGFHRRQSSSSTILLDHAVAGTTPTVASTQRVTASPGRDSPGRLARGAKGKEKEIGGWPEDFLLDYRSTVWCTYRSQYAPIAALSMDLLFPSPKAYLEAQSAPLRGPSITYDQVGSGSKSSWSWIPGVVPTSGLTTDAGWGCMLRTGQSMLANALVRLHLGRSWRRESPPSPTESNYQAIDRYATYVQLLSWFMDDPSAICPFSVHRMALIGKQLGKDVGEWFGPSTAAGAIRTLANAFPPCGLSVVTASDGILYHSEVMEASHTSRSGWEDVEKQLCLPRRSIRSRRESGGGGDRWGSQAVLVLAGIRLGLEGVNAVYHDSVKALFTFPQSVGIAGGRPSSSYYFIGTQADSLFYLDPHFTRPAIPLKTFQGTRSVMTTSDSSHTVMPESYVTVDENQSPTEQDVIGEGQGHGEGEANEPGNDYSERARFLTEAYTESQLSTFHCDKVKKMPMSGLDPSMLLGFLCKDQDDWDDLVARLDSLKHKVLSIQLAPPSWADDDFSDGPSIESFSETNDDLDVGDGNKSGTGSDASGSIRGGSVKTGSRE